MDFVTKNHYLRQSSRRWRRTHLCLPIARKLTNVSLHTSAKDQQSTARKHLRRFTVAVTTPAAVKISKRGRSEHVLAHLFHYGPRPPGPQEMQARRAIRKVKGPFGAKKQSETVISASVFLTHVQFAAGSTPFTRLPDLPNMDPQNYSSMTPPRTGAGIGSNTLESMGVIQCIQGTRATYEDPYQRNFWGIKIDHPGFNACNPAQFVPNAAQFQYVKTTGVVCEIVLPDPPIVRAAPVTITRPENVTDAQLVGIQQVMMTPPGAPPAPPIPPAIWNTTRATGGWQYIVIPPMSGGSVRLEQCVGYDKWQKLLQIGYKPQICRSNTYRISCGAKGYNVQGMVDVGQKLTTLQAGAGVIPPNNGVNLGNGPGVYNSVHRTQETDWVCQYSGAPYADSFSPGALNQVGALVAQGFDVLAFGSAIVFQFVQFAPPTTDTNTVTACVLTVPVTLTVHNKTKFTVLKTTNQDLAQVASLPVVGGV